MEQKSIFNLFLHINEDTGNLNGLFLSFPTISACLSPGCQCNFLGIVLTPHPCDQETGQCVCQQFATGALCDQCVVRQMLYHSYSLRNVFFLSGGIRKIIVFTRSEEHTSELQSR